MSSWRKLVLDVIEGRVPESGDSIREAIERCRCEPPAAESGSFSEAVDRVAKETKKIREKISNLRIQINKLDYWMHSSLRPWDIPPDNMANAVVRAIDILNEIDLDEKYTDKMLERLQKAFDKANTIVSAAKTAEEEKKKKYTTPCEKIFQEFIFGWKKGAGHYKEYEDDTEAERDIRDNVTDYIGSNVAYAEIVKAMKQVRACVKEYPDALRPTVTHAWRGIVANAESAVRFLPMKGLLKSKDRLKIGKRTYIGARGKHKVKSHIESWAAEPQVADYFASQGMNYVREFPVLKSVLSDAKKMMAGKGTERFSDPQDIADEFLSVREEIMETDIPIVFYIKVDGDFIFAEWFADYLSKSQELGKESEVTRISDLGTEKPATVYILADFVDAVNEYNEKVSELRQIMGAKMPKKIKEITFE
jgi:hypothetical protein